MSQAVQQTWAEWAKEHYTAEGKALGEALGQARGQIQSKLEANRQILRRLLKRRFSPLPGALVARIEACDDLGRLEASVSQTLDIQSLDELSL
jgi:hypothetical protein